ncbi:TonB-dependent receptor [Flavihumibacter sediminis]|nr:TonB-dependent receptor [Flavihumibacter sediminis]
MKKQWIMVAATIISSHVSTKLMSQSTGEKQADSSRTLDEVIVTANKQPQKQSSTGKVLTVINRRTLENNAGRTLSQVLNEQAGLIINGAQNSPGTNQTVYLRGAGAANTLILVDGMPVTDGSGITIQFDLNHISIDQVERVEILKGAQSTLYGSDAVAGVINIITRKNQSNKAIGLNGLLAAGTYGTYKGNLGLSGAIDKFNYSVQYNRLQSEGFSSAKDEGGAGNFDKDGVKQDMVNLAAGYKFSEAWTVKSYYQFSEYDADLDDNALEDDRNSGSQQRQQVVGIQSSHQLKNGNLVFNANYNTVRRVYDDPVNIPAGANDWDPSSGDYKGRALFAEAYINTSLQKHLGLLAGIDYRRNTADINTSFGNLGKDSLEASMMSAYAAFTLKGFERFGAELGGRFTQHQDFGDAFTYAFNPYIYLLPQLKLYASVATAFRAPSLYHLASEYGNTALEPERSNQYEGGLHFTSNNKIISARVTAFRRKIKDVIVFAGLPDPPYGQYRNADKQDDKGVETELRVQPNGRWQITANHSWLDGKIETRLAGKDTSYFNLYRRPKHSINLGTSYQFSKKLHVGLSLRWVDKRQDTWYNSATWSTEIKELDSYYNLDAYARYQLNKSFDIFTDFRNITDRKYADLYGYNTRRFNMMAGVRVQL